MSLQRRIAIQSSVFYVALIVFTLVLAHFRDDPLWTTPSPFNPSPSLAISIATGMGFGLLTVFFSQLFYRYFEWARELDAEFQRLLGHWDLGLITLIAVLSGLGEELLFRGWLLNQWGLGISSLLFGLLHLPPTRRFVPWTAMAFVMGLLLGLLFMITGQLIAPIIAHFTINFFNLYFIMSHSSPLPSSEL